MIYVHTAVKLSANHILDPSLIREPKQTFSTVEFPIKDGLLLHRFDDVLTMIIKPKRT